MHTRFTCRPAGVLCIRTRPSARHMTLQQPALPDRTLAPAPAAATLALREVSLSLDGAMLFGPLDLVVAAGEVVTVMGPSGCGKSSLLAWICGTLPPAFAAGGSAILDRWKSTRLNSSH